MKKLTAAIGLLALTFLSTPAVADGDWKLVVRKDGKVKTRPVASNSWKPVFSSRLLTSQKDLVKTGANSVGQLRSSDGSLVTIGPETEVEVSEYDTDAGRVRLNLKGVGSSLKAKVGEYFGGERSFKVVTPNSVLSARGTEFIVLYGEKMDPDSGKKVEVTTLDVLSGVVTGKHKSDTLRIERGQRFTTDGAQFTIGPTPPDFQGIPQPLIPATSGSVAKAERGTMSQFEQGAGGPGVRSATGGVYLNPLLPAFEGAATTTVEINLTITGGP